MESSSSSSSTPAQSVALARYACKLCKKKMMKCSRELPKCAACQPLPGPCNYFRKFPQSMPLKPASSSYTAQDFDAAEVTARLDRIEEGLERLNKAIDRAALSEPQAVEYSSTDYSSDAGILTPTSTIPPHSFSSIHLNNASAREGGPLDYQVAAENLKDLTDALASFRLDASVNISDNPNAHHQGYLVPSQEIGYEIMAKFRPLVHWSKTFFQTPSEDLLHRVIFSPSKVPPGWVIFVNYILLATPETSTDPGLVIMWRWNVRLALQSASLFLVPSHININAFTLLSFHGEDFAASPNTSWMLSSQTCLQAQALALHNPAPSLDYQDRQRHLCQFWSLFNVEKQCALAFGRPSLLPTSQYRNVEIPSSDYIRGFKPHSHSFTPEESQATISEFGAYLFLRDIELAKLTGTIMEFLSSGNKSLVQSIALKAELDAWYNQTNDNFKPSSDPVLNQNQTRLYNFTVKFRYLHTLIILLPQTSALRISSAREAIKILLDTIKTWDPVYNGVIWHLLYYPFTPFFVLFSHIISTPSHEQQQSQSQPMTDSDALIKADLELLRATVNYFSALRAQLKLLGDLTRRLQRTAEVFYGIAVRHARVNHVHVAQQHSTSEPEQSQVHHHNHYQQQQQQQQQQDSNHGEELLFGDVDLSGVAIDKFMSWVSGELVPEGFSLEGQGQGKIGAGGLGSNSGGLVQEGGVGSGTQGGVGSRFSSQGKKRPYEATFDWFSWENYYLEL
ncbi:hypothetical protein QBC43DRAFT_271080 [Cladorrhinum sp. PSN259]|nr:hypothetical protein QBC43DRAFT_271080 [Cladorrhinum sp. PSN259]